MIRRLARFAGGACAGAAVVLGALAGMASTATAATDWASTPDSTIFGLALGPEMGVSGVRIYAQPDDREFAAPLGTSPAAQGR